MKKILLALATASTIISMASAALAETGAPMRMSTVAPDGIAIPDQVETRLGTLRLSDGFPDNPTVTAIHDDLDFQRAVQAYLLGLAPVSMVALREGLTKWGPANITVPTFERGAMVRQDVAPR
jgi:hypothetical protein